MRGVVAVLVLVATSGCLGNDKDSGGDDPLQPGPTASQAFDVELALTGCREAVVMFLISPEQAQSVLPPGFTAGDASSLLELPVPTGQAGVLVGTTQCTASALGPEGHDEGPVSVTVLPPNVPGDRPPAANLYEVGRSTGTPAFAELLRSVNWTLIGDSTTVAVDAPPAAEGTGRIEAGGVGVVSIDVPLAPHEQLIEGTFRWWHASEAGLSYIDYTFASPYYVGPAQCTLAAGSLPAQLVGATSCSGAPSIGFVTTDLGDAHVDFHHLGSVEGF